MNLLNFFFGGEVREGGYHPSAVPPKWMGLSNDAASGVNVDEKTVLGIATAYRCINILANSLACLPLHTYKSEIGKDDKQTKTKLVDDPIYRLLHSKPNRMMTSLYFFQTLMGNAALLGNSYAQIVRNNAGIPVELLPLPESFVTPVLFTPADNSGQMLRYVYKNNSTKEPLVLRDDQVLHIRGLSGDGLVGYSPIRVLREVFGMTHAIEKHGATVFKNGANVRGVLKHPAKLDTGIIEHLRRQWQELYSGSENAGKTVVLEEGMDWKQITMSLQDAQFLDQRKYQAGEICVAYGVPPHMVGNLDRSTFSNMEQQDLFFLRYTMLPWIKTFEQEINDKLFRGDPTKFVEFQINGFARADQSGRYTAYSTGIQSGFLTRNEVRAWENLDPIDGLDEVLTPLNMKEGQDSEPQNDDTNDKNAPENEPKKPIEEPKAEQKTAHNGNLEPKIEAFKPIIKEILERALTREFNKKNTLKDPVKLVEAHNEHCDFLNKILRNSVIAFAELVAPSQLSEQQIADKLAAWVQDYMKQDRSSREIADNQLDFSIDKLLGVLCND